METLIETVVPLLIVFVAGYMLGQHHAIDNITDKIIEDPEGFVNLIKKAKAADTETLELSRDKGVIYCFGTNKGFLAQAPDMPTLAQRIQEALPGKSYLIPAQKDFTTDELYNLAKLLQKNVDNTTTT
jgi:hypothetical protein